MLVQLFDEHARAMRAVAFSILYSVEDAKDVVSQSFLSLQKNILTLRGLSCNKLRPYLVSTI